MLGGFPPRIFLARRQNVIALPSKCQEANGIMHPMNRMPKMSANDDRFEQKVEALLSFDSTASIVDSLLALPDEDELKDAAGALGRVVHGRLQARLAEKMRQTIDQDKDDRSAA